MTDMPVWERRFRAPKMTLPHWPRTVPDRTAFASNESGVWQVHAWHAASGERRKISDHPVGVTHGLVSQDGAAVLFWQEDNGDETGRWLAQAFEGGASEPLLEGVPVGWNDGIALAPGLAAVAIADRDGGFAVFVSLDGAPAKEIARSTEFIGIAGDWDGASDLAGLSADGSLLALMHAEHGDVLHPSLRVVDPRTGGTVGDRGDGSSSVHATAWWPAAPAARIGDARGRPDGTVWSRHPDGAHPDRSLDDRGGEPVAVPSEPGPPGRPFVDWRYPNDHGQEVHGWIVEPDGGGPHPVM